jgi:hypothetical protein
VQIRDEVAMDGRDARSLLGVNDGAGADEIVRAFRACVRVTHPDHGGDRAAFEQVVFAFETLRGPLRAPAAPEPVIALPAAQPRVDVYDSERCAPSRSFDDVLRAAMRAGDLAAAQA